MPVMLEADRTELLQLLTEHPAVYVITNTRAVTEAASRALLVRLRADIDYISETLHVDILVVQRGDSTLRGHVFSEIEVFGHADSLVVFVPAFPGGGRETVDGVHRVLVGDAWVNAADTEFANDPIFGFTERTLRDYAKARSERPVLTCLPTELLATATRSGRGAVIIPDARSNADLQRIGADILTLVDSGRPVVVRSAAPLAAYLAGAKSVSLIEPSTIERDGPILVVAGSHTFAATRQLAALRERWPTLVEIDTDLALSDPVAASAAAAASLRIALGGDDVVVLSTERVRRAEHGSLEDAWHVMSALSSAVAAVADLPGLVIAKGGITSADVARLGLSATTAWVSGQVAVGISLWRIRRQHAEVPYIVVPGNIGGPDTLAELVRKLVDQ